MTYFHTRKCTIIGAVLFHDPVRDGKGWVQNAMAAKQTGCSDGDPSDKLEDGCINWYLYVVIANESLRQSRV